MAEIISLFVHLPIGLNIRQETQLSLRDRATRACQLKSG